MTSIPASATSHNVGYVEGVDHLRGFAAFLVVIHHTYWVALAMLRPPMIGAGWWPKVDNPLAAPLVESHIALCVFFVLSGFILTLAGYGRQISYGQYMRNRCLRVLPVYLTVLFFGLALYPEKFDLLRTISTATIFSNQGVGALDLHPVSTVFWTVAVEFQFYLIFPFLVAVFAGQGKRPLVALIGLMIALRAIGFAIRGDVISLTYWHLVPGRLDQFLIGMLAARVYMRWHDDPRIDTSKPPGPLLAPVLSVLRGRSVGLAAGAVVLFFGWEWGLNRLGGFPVQSWFKIATPTAEALVCTALMLAYLSYVSRLPRLLRRVFSFLGDMSLSTYLCHFMLIGLLVGDPIRLKQFPGHLLAVSGMGIQMTAVLNTVVTVAATVGLSVLFFYGIEKPFMRLRGRYVSAPPSA